jgi:hypothetical protein
MTRITVAQSQMAFAEALFRAYPAFQPTRALFIDFEGSGVIEEVLSLYWPQNRGTNRFRWIWRGADSDALTSKQLLDSLGDLGCDARTLEWAVVFSGGVNISDEQTRFKEVFGPRLLSSVKWINLHKVLRDSTKTKRRIRESRNVWFTGERRVRYSLEALEREFNIERTPDIRSHSNSYRDRKSGHMNVLTSIRNSNAGAADGVEQNALFRYCRQDVRSMFDISRASQKLRAPKSPSKPRTTRPRTTTPRTTRSTITRPTTTRPQARNASSLTALGYNTRLSRGGRWMIISGPALKALGKARIVKELEMFINLANDQGNIPIAVPKWRSDLKRVNELL